MSFANTAPREPVLNSPIAARDLYAYSSYINDRAQALWAAYNRWTQDYPRDRSAPDPCDLRNELNPSWPSPAAKAVMDKADAEKAAGDPDAWDKNCRPALWNNRQLVDIWAPQVPRGGYPTWHLAWNVYFQRFAPSTAGVALGSDFDEIQQWHAELIWISTLADHIGLPGVPDPGPLGEPKSIGQQVGEGLGKNAQDAAAAAAGSASGLIIAGVLVVGGIYLLSQRGKKR